MLSTIKLSRSVQGFIIISLRLARFFLQFLKYVCLAFSVPLSACTAQAGGFRSCVQRIGGILFGLPVRAPRRQVGYFPPCFR